MSRKRRKKKVASVNKHRPDTTVLIFCIVMIIFGAMMIYDASVYLAHQEPFNNQYHFLIQQIIWLLFGSILGLIVYLFDYKKILRFSFPLLIIIASLLLLVLLFGEDVNGAKRWFNIGSLPPIQPAEFAKLAVIMYFATWLSKKEHSYSKFLDALKKGFLKNLPGFLAILGTIALLIFLQPDLGTMLILCITAFIMFFISGKDNAHTLGSIGVILIFTPFAIIAAILEPYRVSRMKTYLDLIFKGEISDPRGSGYQIQQILIGIGSGGLWGKGFGQSRQRFGYLVENTAFTDSTFAIVLEELGFWGGTLLVLGWIFFLWRGFWIAKGVKDTEGRLLASGIIIWLTSQAFLNMAANVGLIPLTGIPLPFLSYGGSSTIVTLIALGLLLNISRYTQND
jgi:cell division protein FtsW